MKSRYERVMKKVDKINSNPTEEELYDFRYTFIEYLIPRLERFIHDSFESIDWEESCPDFDFVKTLDDCIKYFTLVHEEDHRLFVDRQDNIHKAFEALEKIYPYLWW